MDFLKLFETVVLPDSSGLPLVNEKLKHSMENRTFEFDMIPDGTVLDTVEQKC